MKPAEDIIRVAAGFYLEILFLENSVPLHKTLISALAKVGDNKIAICGCFRALCDDYGGKNGRGNRFCVSKVALSMMSSPKLGFLAEVVEECAVLVGLDVVSGLRYVVSETRDGSRPSPIVMEQCQDALSCVYYLLQRYPVKFTVGCSDTNIIEMIMETIVSLLKSPAFTRDCYVAAGVSFCAALQVCLGPEELGVAIMEGVFYNSICCLVDGSVTGIKDVIFKIPFKGDLYSDIRSLCALSRICLMRGILTAVPRTVLNTRFTVSKAVNGLHENEEISHSTRTILYDEILPNLCRYCENPTDSHFNFHALTVMQICLQQIKTSIQANLNNPKEDYNPISKEMGTHLLNIIWNNLEDPLSQTVKQVHLIFDIFLDIQSTLRWSKCHENVKLLLQPIASDLLRWGPRCKGRYAPLASVTKRLGAKFILDMKPNLLLEAANAYLDDDVCCAATTFLKCFLECLRNECWSSDGIEPGYAKYRGICLPPFLFGLASGISKLRTNLNTYALPVLLELDVDSIFPMLSFISVGQREEETKLVYQEFGSTNIHLRVEQKVAILVSLLKVSRSLALIEGDIDWSEDSSASQGGENLRIAESEHFAVFYVKGINVKVQAAWLVMALTHVDESLRVDAGECLFLNPKTASLPSHLELSVLKEAVLLNMRCCSTAFQMKWNSLFRKFFSRVKTALERQIKQRNRQPHSLSDSENVCLCNGTTETTVNRAENLFNFMKWLSSFLFFSCYPSAPYERKMMAMEMMLTMLNIWSIVPTSEPGFSPYNQAFTSPDSTLLLVGSVVDSWDRLRENSFRILLHFPTPLPGICSEEIVQKFIIWAKQLVCSPRVRESDAGALSFRLIFRKYSLELGWMVEPSCDLVSSQPKLLNGEIHNCVSISPSLVYINSLIDWLQALVEEGEKDLYESCRKSFVHGALLTLRYTFEELDWSSDIDSSRLSEMRNSLQKLLELIMRITSLALGVVSADAWHLPEDMDDMVDEDFCLSEVPVDVDISKPSSDHELKNEKPVQDVNISNQIVMVGCWLAMKEVSLLLGTIIRKIPLPTSNFLESGGTDTAGAPVIVSDQVLDFKQLETIGNHFLEVLLKMKHNGAIDKTRAGFSALCNRLLCSNDPSLCKLTAYWMEELMERTVAKGQIVDDLLRRSAGIPAAFTALFLSEPEGTPKRLLPRALRWLIDVANKSLLDLADVDTSKYVTKNNTSSNSEHDRASKIRDEGVVPTVHVFNVLRAAFNDANLSTDTSGFSAEALIIAIRSFSSPYWEIRNSACLAYTALVRRMIGFLNVQKRESARRALTGLEFFHRYPSLHQFLFNELRIAIELLSDVPSHNHSNLAKVVHPSLCPMLILLSRLKPSTIASETSDTLDPFIFMDFIRKCCVQSNYKVRVLASKALTGLVSNEKLPSVLLNIASELPCRGENGISFNSVHGMLLQLNSLLETNCQNLVDVTKKDQIVGDLFEVLDTRSWIGRPKFCPCPTVNSSFLRILDSMLKNVTPGKNTALIRKFLWELSSECLEVEASQRPFYDPTLIELRKQAAISYFSCVLPVSKEVSEEASIVVPKIENAMFTIQQRLVQSMSDASYEVQVATLKWLLLFLKNTASIKSEDQNMNEISIMGWIKTELQTILTNRLKMEKKHKCVLYILKILFTWNSLQFQKQGEQKCEETVYLGNMDYDSILKFWDILVSMCKYTRHAKTRVALICCIGICVKQISDMLSRSLLIELVTIKKAEYEKFHHCITLYTDLIRKYSDPSESVNMRRAASESLVASGLLDQAEVGFFVLKSRISSDEPKKSVIMYAQKILDAWFMCIRLLEDEDDDLRRRLALDVQKCFSSGKSLIAGFVPSQVEKVIEISFEHLSSKFGNWVEYLNYLLKSVFDAANCLVSTGDLVRLVFDKEIDNHHEEKLLICQICCLHLEKLCSNKALVAENSGKIRVREFLFDWRTKFRLQLISFSNDYISKQGEVDWIGSLGNHKDSFLPIYANLLGLYVLSNSISKSGDYEDSESLLADVAELEEIILPFLRNPMISNLYFLIMKLHEKIVGAYSNTSKKVRGDEAGWEGFDPYFLLK